MSDLLSSLGKMAPESKGLSELVITRDEFNDGLDAVKSDVNEIARSFADIVTAATASAADMMSMARTGTALGYADKLDRKPLCISISRLARLPSLEADSMRSDHLARDADRLGDEIKLLAEKLTQRAERSCSSLRPETHQLHSSLQARVDTLTAESDALRAELTACKEDKQNVIADSKRETTEQRLGKDVKSSGQDGVDQLREDIQRLADRFQEHVTKSEALAIPAGGKSQALHDEVERLENAIRENSENIEWLHSELETLNGKCTNGVREDRVARCESFALSEAGAAPESGTALGARSSIELQYEALELQKPEAQPQDMQQAGAASQAQLKEVQDAVQALQALGDEVQNLRLECKTIADMVNNAALGDEVQTLRLECKTIADMVNHAAEDFVWCRNHTESLLEDVNSLMEKSAAKDFHESDCVSEKAKVVQRALDDLRDMQKPQAEAEYLQSALSSVTTMFGDVQSSCKDDIAAVIDCLEQVSNTFYEEMYGPDMRSQIREIVLAMQNSAECAQSPHCIAAEKEQNIVGVEHKQSATTSEHKAVEYLRQQVEELRQGSVLIGAGLNELSARLDGEAVARGAVQQDHEARLMTLDQAIQHGRNNLSELLLQRLEVLEARLEVDRREVAATQENGFATQRKRVSFAMDEKQSCFVAEEKQHGCATEENQICFATEAIEQQQNGFAAEENRHDFATEATEEKQNGLATVEEQDDVAHRVSEYNADDTVDDEYDEYWQAWGWQPSLPASLCEEQASLDSCTSSDAMAEKWSVSVRRGEGAPLGLQMQVKGSALLVEAIKSPGLIERWNSKYPDKAVRVGDLVLDVNGVSDANLAVEECRYARELDINFGRRASCPPGRSSSSSPTVLGHDAREPSHEKPEPGATASSQVLSRTEELQAKTLEQKLAPQERPNLQGRRQAGKSDAGSQASHRRPTLQARQRNRMTVADFLATQRCSAPSP